MTRAADLPPLKRVGHKGADLIAPGNTPESFHAALETGVDMIEFDVLRVRDGRIVLAHGLEDAERRTPLTLEEGLEMFAGEAFAGVELNLDVKIPGYEREVADGLVRNGLVERTVASSHYLDSLRLLGELAPGLRRGLSVPHVRRDYTRSPLAPLALGAVQVMKRRLPARAERLVRAGDVEGFMAHYLFVTRALVESLRRAGGFLYVWTVDDARRIARLEALGVDGVISNDPRLFSA